MLCDKPVAANVDRMTTEQIDNAGFNSGKRWADSADLDAIACVLNFGHRPEQVQTTPAARLATIIDPSATSARAIERALDRFWPKDVSRDAISTGIVFSAAFRRGVAAGYADRRERQKS